ncbi:cell division protein FtsZ [Taibaiella soli]|uniref:Cell division protein FtsZ n=1 Tax=Taibaiella soli TaxID=1649169 RepID=A0A2W2AFQ7_9BACT|nr:cell division protein FtsZ [Taibaiella soli]PZF72342.1 cell division protein FtsZ [Taibaiella soli]
MIHFEIPKNQSSIIKVIGVGGGGSNAVNYMYNLGIDGVDFIVCNTDSQALALSPVPNKIQLGPHLTQGLGAGANPEIGKQASEESIEDITKILKVNTRMAFITAGMGGGTGTGGAPVVSKICRELGVLTVGIVSMPFTYEGRKRMKQAQEGIDRMREHVDTILIISNDKLRMQFGNLPFTQAFAKADDVLATAAKCITDVINTTGQINVDFADVCTVMKNGGVAILGSAAVAGENRSLHAVEQALNSPLLNDNDIRGAKWILLNITSSAGEFEHTMDEAEAIQAYVQQQAGDNCDVILGMGHDPSLEDKIAVTIIATGFNHKEVAPDPAITKRQESEKIIVQLGEVIAESKTPTAVASAATTSSIDPLAPVLVEMPTTPSFTETPTISAPVFTPAAAPVSSVPVPEPTKNDLFSFQPVEKPAMPEPVYNAAPVNNTPTAAVNEVFNNTANTAASSVPVASQETLLQMVIKDELKTEAQNAAFRIGEHVLSAEELEEKRRFEDQKRALEERAERLRKMSFNVKGTESNDEMENVPAYVRRNMDVDNGLASASTFYSGYTVGMNEPKPNNNEASIQTLNTFLEGKKPD